MRTSRNIHRRIALFVEPLENRLFLSASSLSSLSIAKLTRQIRRQLNNSNPIAHPIAVVQSVSHDSSTPPNSALTPSEIASAYGINQITFGPIAGTGAGQTIAIVDAYDDPNAAGDLHQFDVAFGLPDAPSFQRLNQNGVAGAYPTTDPATGSGNTWEVEESLDIEWAHAIAPLASIDLIEAASPTNTNLIKTAVNTARNLPGVVAISMSFSSAESFSETSYDTYFTTPVGHPGVTFLAATGDNGQPGGYPAYSPNVVAVGGTTLTLNNSIYQSESGWSGSGGGVSQVESQPAFQTGVVTQSSSHRATPDVALDADPASGVAVYDSYDFSSSPWLAVGGTSLATPMWAGLIAIADQGRSLASLPSLDGATQTLPTLYKIPTTDFHDITTGNNGFAAGTGFDLVTGLGSPIANSLIPALAGVQSISGSVFQDNNSDGVLDGNDTPIPGATVYLDSNNNGVLDQPTATTINAANVPTTLRGGSTTSSSLSVSGTNDPIQNISVTLNITESRDSNLTVQLVGPDGTTVALFSAIGANSQNFSGTTISSQATIPITSAPPPFTGTFAPSPGVLYAFNGKSANGTWTLRIIDSSRTDTATLSSWSLAVATGEISTAADSNGNFVFDSVPVGNYTLRQIAPLNELQTTPVLGAVAGADPVTVAAAAITGQNFADFLTTVNDSADSDNLYLLLDMSGSTLQIFNTAAPIGSPEYQVPLADLANSSLTVSLSGNSDTLTLDYTNGDPIPSAGLIFNGDSNLTNTLQIIGGPDSGDFTLTDAQLQSAAGPTVNITNLGTLSVSSATMIYTGDFSLFPNLVLNAGTDFTLE